MTRRKPFTKRERSRGLNTGFGHRARNGWGAGDLPAPYAEGDVVFIAEANERTAHMVGTYAVVTYGPSIDEGDAWYFRLTNKADQHSGRLHVAYEGRTVFPWPGGSDFMAGVELVETSDPEGLAERERLLAEGWGLSEHQCHECRGTGTVRIPPDAAARRAARTDQETPNG